MTQATMAWAAAGVLKELPDLRWICEDSAWRAWGGLGYSVKTGQPAFDHVIGRELFDHFKDHPEAAQVFNEAMIRLIVEQVVTDRPGRER